MKAKALIAALALLLTAGFTARAVDGWSVSNPTGSTFRITRSTSGTTEMVKYRTVNLSAYAGQHYTAISGEVTFGPNDTYKDVTVIETTPGTDAFKYQYGAKRMYRFDVTDLGGFSLAHCDREITTGTSFSGSYVNKSVTDLVYFQSGSVKSGSGNKYLDVAHSGTNGTEKMIDDGYDYNDNTLCTVSTGNLYNNNSDLRTWLNSLSYKMYATVYFQQREEDDGYQYIQILADNASTYDGKDPDGNVNTPSTSLYKAAFILTKTEDHLNSWKYQAFPHKSDDHTSSTEFDYSDSYLYAQAFKSSSYRATTSGSLVLNPTVNDINVRFDANGGGDDTWYLKNLKVRLALVDATAPTLLSNSITVVPGRHSKGNTVYVSVAFNEIVKVTGTPTLTTTSSNKWGSLTYVAGDGTNVLTFSGEIPANASGSLNITGLSGTVKDLAGNSLTGSSVTASGLCSLDASYAYSISYDLAGGTLPDGYPATYTYDAAVTLTNPSFLGCTFNGWTGSNGSTPQTTVTIAQYSHGNKSYTANWTDHWDTAHGANGSSTNPYTITDAAGMMYLQEIVEGGNLCNGVYFQVGSDIDLSGVQSTFNGVGGSGINNKFSGIFDGKEYTISNLHIEGTSSYVGLFGYIYGATIENVIIDGATVQGNEEIGAVVGRIGGGGTVQNCFVINSTINGSKYVDAIGYVYSGSASGNHYRNCTINGTVSSDVFTLTVPSGITATVTPTVSYNSVDYFAAGTAVTLSVPSGYVMQNVEVNGTAATDNGDGTWGFNMPAADVTVTATLLPIVSYIDADGTEQNCTNYTVIESSNSDVTLGSSSNSQPAWYVVPAGTVTVNGKLWFYDPDVRLIVCDGATLNVTRNYGNAIQSHGSFTIYGQSQQSGTLTATATSNTGNAICSTNRDINNITINGGTVNATANSYAIRANVGSITINRGNITANSRDNDGIYAHRSSNNVGGDVTINGGTVSATSNGTGYGIDANGTISLGCPTAADRITASSYHGTVTIATGQTLTDGTATYTGTLTSEEIAAIAGKTLQSAAGAVFYIDADGVQRVCVGATQITSSGFYGSNSNAEGWYYVSGEVSLNSRLVFSDQNVHLIICDGANLIIDTSNSSNAALVFLEYASIYGQSGGSGSITITSKDNGIGISASISTFSINGGNISVVASEGSGIYTNGDVLIRRGTVNVTGSYGIRGANISILGGNVTATGTGTTQVGIYSRSNLITLGWSESGDSITASSYVFPSNTDGILLIATGQALTDGTNTYTGLLNTEQIATIAGKTLRPAENPSDDNLGLTARKSKFGGISKYFTTFYHPTKNYKLLDGAQAFTLNGSKQFYLVGDGSIVPANCAVVIFADKPAVSLTAIDISNPPSPVGTNILQGVGVATAASTLVTGTQKVYVISGYNNSIGLYEYTGTTIPAYKAYIVE
jgi:uncharacterized repeat protein (TIGR02543 family)